MAIKESLQDSRSDQYQIVGEAGDVAEETFTSWMERIHELTEEYSSENITNMDESGCFLRLCLIKD